MNVIKGITDEEKLIVLRPNPQNHNLDKNIPLFRSAIVIGTPDFSVYPNMNPIEILHNVYMSRWLGCVWQNYGCIVIPTISWCNEDTYDICFRGVEEGSVVLISTLGCLDNKEVFLNGFYEMKRRLKPSLTIVYGNMIDGMTGRFVNIKYNETFNGNRIQKYKQLKLFEMSKIFERKDVI